MVEVYMQQKICINNILQNTIKTHLKTTAQN